MQAERCHNHRREAELVRPVNVAQETYPEPVPCLNGKAEASAEARWWHIVDCEGFCASSLKELRVLSLLKKDANAHRNQRRVELARCCDA